MVNDVPVKARDNNGQLVIELLSRGSCSLEISALIAEQTVSIFPFVEERGLLFVQLKKNRIQLSAGPFIGLIPLAPNILVDVRPKLPVYNLARVLDTARGSLATISGARRDYEKDVLLGVSIFDFLSMSLVEAFKPILADGFHKEYAKMSFITDQPRGRIDPRRTFQYCWRRGKQHHVFVSKFEQTADLAVNRIIKAALEFVLTQSNARVRRSRWKAEASGIFRLLPRNIGRMKEDDLEICKKIVQLKQLPAGKAYYYRALDIASLMMENKGISLEGRGADIALDTFIVNFEEIFEDYIRHVLADRCPEGCWVRDGNREGKKPLFDEGREPRAQPDIVIIDIRTRTKVIVEVKYKERLSREDYNQAFTYAVSYRTKTVVLVHQSSQTRSSGLRKIGSIDGIQLLSYAIDLSSVDIAREEERLSGQLFQLLFPRQ